MIKSLMILMSTFAFAACDGMPNKSAADSKTMPSTSRSDATMAPTAGTNPSSNGAAAGDRAGNRSDAGNAGTSESGMKDATPSGVAPK